MRLALPFTGGWLLYLGYELADEIEPRLRLPPSADPVTALAIRAPAAWIRDRRSAQAWLVAEPGYEALLDRFEEDVRRAGVSPRVATQRIEIHEESDAQFLRSVGRALEYIAAGDVYQANLSRQWQGRSPARDRSGVDLQASAHHQPESVRSAHARRGFRRDELISGAADVRFTAVSSRRGRLRARGRAVPRPPPMRGWSDRCSTTRRSARST